MPLKPRDPSFGEAHPELLATAILRWITAAGIDTALIDPGKPWQNGTGASFNGKFRDECLDMEWSRTRAGECF